MWKLLRLSIGKTAFEAAELDRRVLFNQPLCSGGCPLASYIAVVRTHGVQHGTSRDTGR